MLHGGHFGCWVRLYPDFLRVRGALPITITTDEHDGETRFCYLVSNARLSKQIVNE